MQIFDVLEPDSLLERELVDINMSCEKDKALALLTFTHADDQLVNYYGVTSFGKISTINQGTSFLIALKYTFWWSK